MEKSSTRRPSASSTRRVQALVPAGIVAACLVVGWGASLISLSAGRSWDGRPGDAFFRLRYALRGPERVLPAIAHVDLTDAMERELSLKGGDRRVFARLVRVLGQAGASSVVFDIIFPQRGSGDMDFVDAARGAGNVHTPAVMRPESFGAFADSAAPTSPAVAGLWHPRVERAGFPPRASGATESYRELVDASRGIGFINAEPDPDGVIRRVPLLYAYGDGFMPSIALETACAALGVDPRTIVVRFGRDIRLPGAALPDGTTRDIVIPVDARGRMIVDYAGPWSKSFAHYSFARLLDAESDQDLADQVSTELDGARLIVSDLTTSAGDYGPSPFEAVYPLSGMHANVLNSILSDRFLRAPSFVTCLLLAILLGAALWLLAWRLRPLHFALLSLPCWAAFAALELWLFLRWGLMPALAGPTVAAVLAVVGVLAWRFAQSQRERMRMRMRMERYFAPNVMSRILQTPGRLMTAEKKEISVLFSDISGFTSWSTTQTPEIIHATLNEYFEVMTEIVFRHEGTVDKFIGDGLMAFFGDPLPQADHPLRAVMTAVEMQQAMRGLRARWTAEGRMPLHIRIGINTGDVVVGDMGSTRIMAYTAIGSNINLGSRLESKSPIDGVLVSAPVHERVKDAVKWRFAGKITAKGITEEFDTFEILVPGEEPAKLDTRI
jgi:adenylate cyclase